MNLFELEDHEYCEDVDNREIHMCGNFCCATEPRATPALEADGNPVDLVLDASTGYVPLWAQNQTIRWAIDWSTIARYKNRRALFRLMYKYVLDGYNMWGDAAPVKLKYSGGNVDMVVGLSPQDQCNANGACVLASAFMPNSGLNRMTIFPKMFSQSEKERQETMAHEWGHAFGLRHSFAKDTEGRWPSRQFGSDFSYTIMNYGDRSVMTNQDRRTLKRLYNGVWSGRIRSVGGVPVRLVRT